jgi:uncharacterized phage-associated protein
VAVLSAHDIAAEIRRRLPDVGTKKLHKLLYYCQGHHLAAFDEPMFSETLSAFDMGPVVGELWFTEKEQGEAQVTQELSESQLNTVGYVLSRYGALSGKDLENLTHNESPWRNADQVRRQRRARRSAITIEDLKDYFRNEPSDDADNELALDRDEVAAWLSDAESRRTNNPRRDSVDELRQRLEAIA